MNYSSTLGFSPHPPVSVYGTSIYMQSTTLFLAAGLTPLSLRPKAPSTVGVQPNAGRICLPRSLHPSTPVRYGAGGSLLRHALDYHMQMVAEYSTALPSTTPFGFALGLDLP